MKPEKGSGSDNVPLEYFCHGGLELKKDPDNAPDTLKSGKIKQSPGSLKMPTLLMIFKKGDCSIWGNYRGISLLCIAVKIFTWILLNRLLRATEEIPMWLPTFESYCLHATAPGEKSWSAKATDVHLGFPEGLRQSRMTSIVGHFWPLWLSGSLRVPDPYAHRRKGGPSELSGCSLGPVSV